MRNKIRHFLLLAVLFLSLVGCYSDPYETTGNYINNSSDTVNLSYRISSISIFDTLEREIDIRFYLDTGSFLAWRQIEVSNLIQTQRYACEYENSLLARLTNESNLELIELKYAYNRFLGKHVPTTILVNHIQDPYAILFYFDSAYCTRIERRKIDPFSGLVTGIIQDELNFCKASDFSSCSDSGFANYGYVARKNPMYLSRELIPVLGILREPKAADLYHFEALMPLFFGKQIPNYAERPRDIEYQYGLNQNFDYTFFYCKNAENKKIDGFLLSYFIE